MGKTAIEWSEHVWNCVRGCDVVSPGCKNCYAMRTAHRFSGPGQPYEGLTEIRSGKPTWVGLSRFVPEMLSVPLARKKPTTFFVNSMSDLFHEDITNEQIAAVFGVMAACPQHTFQVLTKRAERLPEWFRWYEGASGAGADPMAAVMTAVQVVPGTAESSAHWYELGKRAPWPLPNVHLGVSAEDQQRADERILHLLSVPAAVRWVSAEPLLGPIDLTKLPPLKGFRVTPLNALTAGKLSETPWQLNWVVAGAESGPGARPMNEDWIRSLRDQCRSAGVPFFYKQRLERGRKVSLPVLDGQRWTEVPR